MKHLLMTSTQNVVRGKFIRPQNKPTNDPVQKLLEWSAALSSQLTTQQIDKLQKKVVELAAADIDDELRLQLMGIITTALDRLVTVLQAHYLYELDSLSEKQLGYANQVKSLYYYAVIVYGDIIERQMMHLKRQQKATKKGKLPRLPTSSQSSLSLLSNAIYQTLLYYHKIIYEKAISYQKSANHLWSAINQLYYLADQQNIAHKNLSTQIATPHALSIHELYVQLSLFSILNVKAMHRPNITLIQRSISNWATYTSVTSKPKTKTQIFVDLHSDKPPELLSANSSINPYDENNDCLFIELNSLADYLLLQKQQLNLTKAESIEYHLVNQALSIINYRYLNRPKIVFNRHSSIVSAKMTSKLDHIHYQVAGKIGLKSLLGKSSLPLNQVPRYDTEPKSSTDSGFITVRTYNTVDTESPFRVLQLSTPLSTNDVSIDNIKKTPIQTFKSSQKSENSLSDSLSAALSEMAQDIAAIDDPLINNKAPLQLQDLMLLEEPSIDNDSTWSLGMVRWLDLDAKDIEVEWQLLGHRLTACALRLNNYDSNNLSYVPALIIAGEDTLQTKNSLLVPSYHFRSGDRVILCQHEQESVLYLGQCITSTKTFSQYEFVLVLS